MTGSQLLAQRKLRRWEQAETAIKLKVSQPYLSLLEAGKRPVTKKLARRAVRVFDLPPTSLPLEDNPKTVRVPAADRLASQLAALGYPKLSHLPKSKTVNPAVVLMTALESDELESRIVEGLVWLVYTFPDLDWQRVVVAAKVADAQNRLGFLTALGREKAERSGEEGKVAIFDERLEALEQSRLYREDSFRRKSLSKAERKWLEDNRPPLARYWRILSNLTAEVVQW